jgi:hypothetical protein
LPVPQSKGTIAYRTFTQLLALIDSLACAPAINPAAAGWLSQNLGSSHAYVFCIARAGALYQTPCGERPPQATEESHFRMGLLYMPLFCSSQPHGPTPSGARLRHADDPSA